MIASDGQEEVTIPEAALVAPPDPPGGGGGCLFLLLGGVEGGASAFRGVLGSASECCIHLRKRFALMLLGQQNVLYKCLFLLVWSICVAISVTHTKLTNTLIQMIIGG